MGKFEKKPQRTQKKSGSKKTVLLVSVIAAVVLVVGVFAAFLLLRDDGKIVGNLYLKQKHGPFSFPSAVWLNTTSRMTSIPFSFSSRIRRFNSSPS